MSKNPIKIGFVILTWNSEAYISDCLDSIFSLLDVVPFVSVFDNGSTDKTVEILKKYENRWDFVFTKSPINLGTTASRNEAFSKLPEVDFVCVLDSDTKILNSEAFVSMVNYLNDHKEIGLIGPKLLDKEGNIQPSAKPIPTLKDKFLQFFPLKALKDKIKVRNNLLRYLDNPNEVIYAGYLISACFVVKQETFKKISGFDEKIFYAPEDIDFCLRIHQLGLKCVLFKSCEILHYWQRISRKKLFSKHNFEHIKGLFYMKRKFNKSLFKFINEDSIGRNSK